MVVVIVLGRRLSEVAAVAGPRLARDRQLFHPSFWLRAITDSQCACHRYDAETYLRRFAARDHVNQRRICPSSVLRRQPTASVGDGNLTPPINQLLPPTTTTSALLSTAALSRLDRDHEHRRTHTQTSARSHTRTHTHTSTQTNTQMTIATDIQN